MKSKKRKEHFQATFIKFSTHYTLVLSKKCQTEEHEDWGLSFILADACTNRWSSINFYQSILISTVVLICVSQIKTESEQDLESFFMMLQNSGHEWLECKPLPITLQSRVRDEQVRLGMNMEISTQPSPKLGESRKEVHFSLIWDGTYCFNQR